MAPLALRPPILTPPPLPLLLLLIVAHQLMDHGLKGGGKEGAGRKERSIIVVACISSYFLLLARLPQWIDTKNLVVASQRDIAMPLCRLIWPLTLSDLGKNANNNPRY